MSAYVNGEIVNIQLLDAEVIRTEEEDGTESVVVQLRGDDGYRVEVPVTAGGVLIRRVRPAGGMPKPGDVWADKYGAVYFAKQESGGDGAVRFVSPDPSTHLWVMVEDINQQFGPLTLLFRPSTGGVS